MFCFESVETVPIHSILFYPILFKKKKILFYSIHPILLNSILFLSILSYLDSILFLNNSIPPVVLWV